VSATFYREYTGDARHASRVACVWAQRAEAPYVQRVVPDGCVDVLLIGTELQVAGPDTRAVPARLGPDAPVTGVRFQPGQAPGVLGVPMDALRDQRVPLAELWGADAERIVERVGVAVAEEAPGAVRGYGAARALEELVLARAAEAPDAVAVATGRALCPGGGWPRVARVAEDLGLSERQLRRRCLTAFGYGPKTLQRVIRFQRALRAARAPDADLAAIAYRFGYADQAHLSREVRALAGAPLTSLI